MDDNFESLLNDILENPELILQKDFTDDQIFELQKRISPYKNFSSEGVDDPNFKKILIFSYTNLKEEYLKKYLMTSLIGFIFQIKNEVEIDIKDRVFADNAKINKINKIISIIKDASVKEAASVEGAASVKDASVEAASVEGAEEVKDASVEDASVEDNIADNCDSIIPKQESLLDKAVNLLEQLSAEMNVIEFSEDIGRNLINNFLLDLFKFDPNKHVRSATIDESKIEEEINQIFENEVISDAKDPSRLPLKTLLSSPTITEPEHKDIFSRITENNSVYNAFCTILGDDQYISDILSVIENREAFKSYLFPLSKNSPVLPAAEILPPRDVFHRWSYYNEVNLEEIRRVTASLYLEKPDLDLLIGAWNTIEGDPEKVNKQFNEYCQKYQSEFPADIKSADFGGWTFIGDFKKNREKINFYNRNTEVLKRILDRHESDKQLGADLMKNRIRQKKAKNIAEDGPDAQGLAQYRSVHGISLPGAEKVISHEEMLRLEKSKGNIKAAKELEFLENLESQIQIFLNLEKTRELTKEELNEFTLCKERLEMAHQMAEVPDDGIQVDVFTNDTRAGTFNKSSFYTKSEELINSHKPSV